MYRASSLPFDDKELKSYIAAELKKIEQELSTQTDILRLGTTYLSPPKPREGDIRLADGTTWNPGAGAGFYGYRGAAWHLLG